MLKTFFRWLYHHRQRQAARNRLQGRRKLMPQFRRFTSSAFERATFGKYDSGGIHKGWKGVVLLTAVGALVAWILWESITALSMFQP
ncbi:MAG: hypothetical protein ACQKBV_07110 [Puniceicoccales bacterium]